MLTACRTDATQYTIWHRAHTAPALAQDHPAIRDLLHVDIDALASIVDNLCFALFRLNRQSEIPVMLERLRGNINHPKWQRKITYFQSLLLHVENDTQSAKREFEKLGEIGNSEDDLEILQLYIDIYGDELPFARKIAACDHILKLSSSISDILQYGGLKAISFVGIGDFEQARTILALAIAEARRRELEEPLSIRTRYLLAGLLTHQALVAEKSAKLDEAISLYHDLLAEGDAWTPGGQALLHQALGECFRYAAKWEDGEAAYRSALMTQANGITSVFLSECLVRQKKFKEAIEIFDAVDATALGNDERIDHAYTAAIIAVEMQDGERMKSAIKLLKSVRASVPYFEERRLSLLVQLQEALANGKSPVRMKSLGDRLRRPLQKLSRYAIMQPSLFGFGININAVIDDAASKDKDDDRK